MEKLLDQLRNRNLLVVNPRRRNGVILYKHFHAEFAGPGAVIGSIFDVDIVDILPVGNLSIITPQNAQERQKAYLIRRQWVRLIKQITDNPVSIERAQIILNQFENWFDMETIATLPDDAFALLVGVLPQTISRVKSKVERIE